MTWAAAKWIGDAALRRLRAALMAAFLIALPLFPMLVLGLTAGAVSFGLVVWLALFVPALLGILLLQLPLKIVLLRRGWSDGKVRGVLTVANCILTVGLWQAGSGGVPVVWSAVLAGCAALAVQIWYALDDRALFGAHYYANWKNHA